MLKMMIIVSAEGITVEPTEKVGGMRLGHWEAGTPILIPYQPGKPR
jgi:hypothetical protein